VHVPRREHVLLVGEDSGVHLKRQKAQPRKAIVVHEYHGVGRSLKYFFFFLGGVTAMAPSRDLTDNKKKEEGGLKQRRKQKEAAQKDPEPKKGNQEKEKYPSRVQS